jgi:hypothetical protein
MARRRTGVIVAASLLAAMANPSTIPFDDDWRPLTFPRIAATRFTFRSDTAGIVADSSSSAIVRGVPEALQDSRSARWRWRVARSVPATDLAVKGGDDRNIAVYFVFLDRAGGKRAQMSARRMLTSPDARLLIYSWGGRHTVGSLLPSPYFKGRGITIVRRTAGTGAFAEMVDLARDHAAAFGVPLGRLVGIGVSADSDDTRSTIHAEISEIALD